ncbi:serine hydrolase domain-containing protein [Archangium lipolyticum]|uniref:serine hydrolase domain-containing protein n=1 Tax=Archangium lipolyticum TaxID=2970465 RepID=UPI002149D39E|nr:serine hydrolase domain-containing protein [Archangium lipolyticum]
MMKRFVLATALSLGVSWSTACAEPSSPPEMQYQPCLQRRPSLPRELKESIDQLVEERMRHGRIPGLSLVVVRDGKPVYVRGYGSANLESGEPMTACTRVSVGSTTKSMTALALLQLVEQGKVDLEAPVTRYLPWFQTADGRGSGILVKQLLSHTSGMPAKSLLEGTTDDGALERRVRSFSQLSLAFPPGQGWMYSNTGYAVLGLIVQTVSGMPYEQYLANHVFQPLGMNHTTFGPPPEATGHLAQGYAWTRGNTRPVPMLLAREQHPAGASTYSSAHDVSRYLAAMLAKGRGVHGRVITPETLHQMWQPAAATSADAAYGWGWELGPMSGRQAVYHDGSVIGSGSMFMLFPEDNLAVATLANLNGPHQQELAKSVAALLLGAEPPPAPPLVYRAPSTFVPDTSVWQRYVGDYVLHIYGRMRLYEESGRLLADWTYTTPTQVLELEAYGDNDFVIRNDLGINDGMNVSFQGTADGQMLLLVDGQPLGRRL